MNHIIQSIRSSEAVMMHEASLRAYVDKVERAEAMFQASSEPIEKVFEMVFGKRPKMVKMGPLAYIPLNGVMGKGLTTLDKLSGSIDVDDLSDWVDEAMDDPEVKVLFMDNDSPGGSVRGLYELADKYHAAGKSKPTVSFTDKRSCSASYYVASQANEFYATPSSEVGCIGTIMCWPDVTEALAKEGIKMQAIYSGKHKAALFEGIPLNDADRKMLQDEVNDLHGEFKGKVKRVRTSVADADMEGQSFVGRVAAQKGLVTGLKSSLREAIEHAIATHAV
jgi:signal peptide peptidase SppA